VWLLHWSLFVFYHLPNGHNNLLELFLSNEKYQRAIEMKAPWLLRYVIVSLILTKNQHQNNPTGNVGPNIRLRRELVKLVDQESYNYTDPITEFIRNLYIKCDFDLAEKSLGDCVAILNQDFFIATGQILALESYGSDGAKSGLAEQFASEGRVAICESFCKIHNCININMMIAKLQGKATKPLSQQDAEKWIVSLIRNVKLDAKIDTAKNQVIITSHAPSAYQLLLEKTKTMALRAGILASNLDHHQSASPVAPVVGSVPGPIAALAGDVFPLVDDSKARRPQYDDELDLDDL